MDAKKANRKSASKWEQSSERALLEVWRDRISELRGCRKNSHILQEIAAEMQLQGYSYSVMEIKTKMNNMTARYRKEKQQMGTTGGSPSEWDLYKEMEILLAPYKSYHSENLVYDNINHINSSIVSLDTNSTSTPPLASPSPLPSPTMVSSPLSSPTESEKPQPSEPSSTATMKTKEAFEKFLKSLGKNIEKMQGDMKKTSERLIAIEEEKKNILKAYSEKEAEVQNALIAFLKRP